MAKHWEMKQSGEDAKKAAATGDWLESLFQNSKDPIAFADVNGNFQALNRAFEDLTGYSQDELVEQKTFMEITPKKYAAFEARLVRRVIETGASTEFEKEYIRKDGSHIPILINAFQVKNEAGEPIGTGAILKDLTERKKIESKLNNLARFPAENPFPVLRIAKDGTVLFANAAAQPLLDGGDVGQAASRFWKKLSADVLKSGEVKKGVEIELERKGRILSFTAVPVPEGDYVNLYGLDVTERKQAEGQIKDLAKFPSENPSPVLRIAADGTVLFANAAAQPLLDGGDVGQAAPRFWKKLSADVLKSGEVKKGVEIERKGRILSFTAVPVPEGDYVNLYGLDVTERKRAEQITRQSLSDTEALHRLSARSTETLELDEVLDTALREIATVLGVLHGCIYIFDQSGNLVIQSQQQLSDQFLEAKSTVSAHEGCAGQAVETKKMFAPAREEHDFTCEDSKRLLGLDCLVAIPIISKGSVLGVLELFAPVHRRLSRRERRIITTMADQLGVAVENANLYSKERNIANTLQETLLTVPEKIEGVNFGSLYRSATAEAAKAGGDFYDLFELKHDKLGIVIGDVSGKGLEAASLTSLVKNTIKAYAYQHASPAKVIAMTNDVIVGTSDPSTFVTLFFGVLDKESGLLRYCNAGHPQPIMRRQPSAVSVLKRGAPVIGVFDDLECKEFEEILRGNDVLFLYTDGAIEARGELGLYSEERLLDLIKDLHSTKARELPQRVFDRLFDFAQGTMADDTALLAISLERETSA